jgi:hypothetical protein
MRLTHTAGNELSDLRAEVEDEDFLVKHESGQVRQMTLNEGDFPTGRP